MKMIMEHYETLVEYMIKQNVSAIPDVNDTILYGDSNKVDWKDLNGNELPDCEFIVMERIFDYNDNTIHLRLKPSSE